jgi:hypothetical protein
VTPPLKKFVDFAEAHKACLQSLNRIRVCHTLEAAYAALQIEDLCWLVSVLDPPAADYWAFRKALGLGPDPTAASWYFELRIASGCSAGNDPVPERLKKFFTIRRLSGWLKARA